MKDRCVLLASFACLGVLGCAGEAFGYAVSVSYDIYEVLDNRVQYKVIRSKTFSSTTGGTSASIEHVENIPPVSAAGGQLVGDLDGHARIGSLGAGANGHVSADQSGTFGKFQIDVRATMSDVITFESSDPRATQIRIGGEVKLNGGIDNTYVYPGGAAAGVKLYGTGIAPAPYPGDFYGYSNHGCCGPFVTSIDLPVPATIHYLFDVPVGVPIPLVLTLEVFGEADASNNGTNAGSATFSADFLHTLTWGGIDVVTEVATGTPITNWSVTSESGFNYANAFVESNGVPEPTTLALLSIGLAGFGFSRRKLIAH